MLATRGSLTSCTEITRILQSHVIKPSYTVYDKTFGGNVHIFINRESVTTECFPAW